MFSKFVFLTSTIKYRKLVGKDWRSNQKQNYFSNLNYQIHPLKQCLKWIFSIVLLLLGMNFLSSVLPQKSAFCLLSLSSLFEFQLLCHYRPAEELWVFGFLIWLSEKVILKSYFIEEHQFGPTCWAMPRIADPM